MHTSTWDYGTQGRPTFLKLSNASIMLLNWSSLTNHRDNPQTMRLSSKEMQSTISLSASTPLVIEIRPLRTCSRLIA